MIELFEKYVDWKVLSAFLKNPTDSFYIKQLAKNLKISPSSVSSMVKKLEKENLLTKEVQGLAHLYRFNNDHPAAKYLKIVWTLFYISSYNLVGNFLKIDEDLISLAIYGSYGSGSYDSKSDLDLLLVSSKDRGSFAKLIRDFEAYFKIPVTLEVFNVSAWHRLKKQKDIFYKSVAANHVLLYGSELS